MNKGSKNNCAYCMEKAAREFFDKSKGHEKDGYWGDGMDNNTVNANAMLDGYLESLRMQGKYEEAKDIPNQVGAKDWMDPYSFSSNFGEGEGWTKKLADGQKNADAYYGEEGPVQAFKKSLDESLGKVEDVKKKLEDLKKKLEDFKAKEEPKKNDTWPKEPGEWTTNNADPEVQEQNQKDVDEQKKLYEEYKKYDDEKKEIEKELTTAEGEYKAIIEAINKAADSYVNGSTKGWPIYTNPERENTILGGLYEKLSKLDGLKETYDGITKAAEGLEFETYKPDPKVAEGLSDQTKRAVEKRSTGGTAPQLSKFDNWAGTLGGAGGCTCGGWKRAGATEKTEDSTKTEDTKTEETKKETTTSTVNDNPWKKILDRRLEHAKELAEKYGLKMPPEGSEESENISRKLEGEQTEKDVKQAFENYFPEGLLKNNTETNLKTWDARKAYVQQQIDGDAEIQALLKSNENKVLPPSDSYFWNQAWSTRNNPKELKKLVESNLLSKDSKSSKTDEGDKTSITDTLGGGDDD